MDDDYIKAVTDEANRMAHERWTLLEFPVKEWVTRLIFEAQEKLKKDAVQG